MNTQYGVQGPDGKVGGKGNGGHGQCQFGF